MEQDTICALATPAGSGAIAVIRLSGDKSLEIADKIFKSSREDSLKDAEGYTVRYGQILNEEGILDQVLVTVFRSPASYTGEDSVEISCHCSPFIINEILSLLVKNGARMAAAGEFTQRSFLHGKMDLAQAEAVADLIASETASAHRVALSQMRGGFSAELSSMRADLLEIVALMELELDFSEEEVEFADRTHLRSLVDDLLAHIGELISGFKLGNVIKNGIPVAIAGATNTGKSTLLNTILGEERAIVSPIHGTTRDYIEDTVNIDGTLFRFIDTAGIRQTHETLENIGIERTFEKIRQATVVLLMLDATRPDNFDDSINTLTLKVDQSQQKVIILINKCDLVLDLPKSGSGKDAILIKETKSDGDTMSANATILDEDEKSVNDTISGEDEMEDEMSAKYAIEVDDIDAILGKYVENVREYSASAGLSPTAIIPISASRHLGLDSIKKTLHSICTVGTTHGNSVLVTNLRHFEALQNSHSALTRVAEGLETTLPTDLLTQDLREALHHLGTITGAITTDEVLGEIFSKFCIGK
ncbi:MAG: tRNA uridine-5-carboxymethylaminomethyl(34) synthesis GTPase MnmE [Bacteroidales bacterium]|nr:tRNA uridine-5-carboxymethylaminomethyl(34) synthesis GTPase MnmE [Bacteroidales bacterium]